ncbi:hypothetical protein TPHA_0J01130 [Tetrapisispora phaffii CBS 4417]|uniref:Translation initiation factor eIF2B subunit delta n=1 Tax=Tetrapisispora phaffii (strain ATCC 24235 / CBS 4417 / NBRC 1672 / NRRL Y-8282 / UCD 70-5) TaxID=1071381 RepID=G8BYJ3_TETPH|nr:hypothetical protein TPHA_0J01130 [Tetrapisispora phaffii CBS 4417]CCE64935.1 hypothetical protein TPHA_0J01130 [Tetrapisispora phaffii CBS 4417]
MNEVQEANKVKEKDAPVTTPETAGDSQKLSNKELKELKKKEKAAKRSAKKQENGISIEQQQAQAEAKKEKKQHQREKQLKQQEDKKMKQMHKDKESVMRGENKSTLFSHLETTAERRAAILAFTSSVNSPLASKITATGLAIPTIAGVLSGSNVATTSPLGQNGSIVPSTTNGSVGEIETSSKAPSVSEMAKSLADFTLHEEENSIVPGVTSVVPHSLENNINTSQFSTVVKEILINKDLIHPVIVKLTSSLAQYKIVGSIPRCIAMLEAFQIVIEDYQTPPGTTLSRNLTNYLSHQIDVLTKARPLSVTMGNAIRWLKQEISLIDPSTPDKEAKRDLCEAIAQFAREKIELADRLIIENASQHLTDGSSIVTYGASKVLKDLIIENAVVKKKDIEVTVVDSRPLFEGRKMAEFLRRNGVKVTYALITSLDTIFNMKVDYVFLGTHSILSNGFLYSRAGTAMVAMSAKQKNIPVLVCCESLKFSQRVQLDSVTYNELADPNDLVNINYSNPSQKYGNTGSLLQRFVQEREAAREKDEVDMNQKGKKSQAPSNKGKDKETANDDADINKNILDNWQKSPNLNIINILYDLTPPDYIKKIITEFGALPPSSVPVILREYKGSA